MSLANAFTSALVAFFEASAPPALSALLAASSRATMLASVMPPCDAAAGAPPLAPAVPVSEVDSADAAELWSRATLRSAELQAAKAPRRISPTGNVALTARVFLIRIPLGSGGYEFYSVGRGADVTKVTLQSGGVGADTTGESPDLPGALSRSRGIGG